MVRRGYDPLQVQEHLENQAARIRKLQDELYRVRAQLGAVGPGAVPDGLDPYGALADQVSELLRAAGKQAEEIRNRANEEAARKLEETRREAEGMRRDADAESESIRAEREEAKRAAEAEVQDMLRQARDEAARIRAEGGEALRDAVAKAKRVLTQANSQQEQVLGELHAIREGLNALSRLRTMSIKWTSEGPPEGAE